MFQILAVIAFVIAMIFLAASVTAGVFTWQLIALIALTLWCISGHPKVP